MTKDTDDPPEGDEDAAMAKGEGTTVTVGQSQFGEMLFDANRQAIYIFEKDPKGETVCYDECAEAWPPVFTVGEAVAGMGVKASLLGTVKRRDGKLQVTYAGKPLYHYAHEGPGEVRCHNVNLNGGLWWVWGRTGSRDRETPCRRRMAVRGTARRGARAGRDGGRDQDHRPRIAVWEDALGPGSPGRLHLPARQARQVALLQRVRRGLAAALHERPARGGTRSP